MKRRIFILLLLILFITFLLWSYFTQHKQESGNVLRVVTKNSPTTFYYDRYDSKSGFEYEMLKAYSEASGKLLELKIVSDIQSMHQLLKEKKVDLIANGISITQKRLDQAWVFGPVYAKTKEVLICRRGVSIFPGESAGQKKLLVVKGSSYIKTLKENGYTIEDWTQLQTNTEELLGMVENMEADCTVSDEHIYRNQARSAENLVLKKTLKSGIELAWVIGEHKKELKKEIEKWMFDYLSSGKLEVLYEKYYGHTDPKYNHYAAQTFMERKTQRLGHYIRFFKEASKKYDMPWELIAAISYQESHWDPEAVSPTGVRGMMMLTRQTARLMKVNRLKVEESIDGGVRYFLYIKGRLPKSIKEPDRTWISLAAYNVGIGHIYDVRKLIRKNRGNPDSWKEIKFYLPYLSKKNVYKNLRYGYARGWEPVKYVKRIRNYYEILKNIEEDEILDLEQKAKKD